MVDSPTTRNRLRKQEVGTNNNTWATKLNEVLDCVDQVVDGVESVDLGAATSYSLTTSDYTTSDQAKNRVLVCSNVHPSGSDLIVPSVEHVYGVRNSGAAVIEVKTAAGTGVEINPGRFVWLYCDGTNVEFATSNALATSFTPSNNNDVTSKTYVDTAIATAVAAASGTLNGAFRSAYVYTLAPGVTTISGADDNGNTLAYTAGMSFRNLSVTLNGVLQTPGTDYTASTGTSVVLALALTKSVTAVILSLEPFNVANTYTQAQVDALLAALMATPPVGGFGSTTPRPVAATTLSATGTTGLAALNATQLAVSGPSALQTTSVSTFAATQNATLSGTLACTGVGTFSAGTSGQAAARFTGNATSTQLELQRTSDFVGSGFIGANQFRALTVTLTANGTELFGVSSSGGVIAGSASVTIADAVGLIGLKSYTVGTVPTATAQFLIYVSDGTSNKRLAVSDGTNWRFPDGNIVS